jgi:hypothetical protein
MLVFKQSLIFFKRVVTLQRLIFLHWESFLVKTHLILCSDSAPCVQLVHLGQCNTNININVNININDPVCVISPKANRGAESCAESRMFMPKNFPTSNIV